MWPANESSSWRQVGSVAAGLDRACEWSRTNFILCLDFLIAVLSVGVILGFMILIHEFGHYAVAKLLGVRVEVFSIGFGKRLFGFRRGDTDYRIAAIPLGGYVKMSGENPMDDRTGDPGEFMSHPRWHRFLIAIAGPAMNILFAIGLLTCVYMVHYEYPRCSTSLRSSDGWCRTLPRPKPESRLATASSGLMASRTRPGSRSILREALNPNQPLEVTIERGGQTSHENHRARGLRPEPDGLRRMGAEGAQLPDHRPGVGHAGRKGRNEAGRRDRQRGRAADRRPCGHDREPEAHQGQADPDHGQARRPAAELHGAAGFVRHSEATQRYRVGIGSAPMKVSSLPFAAAFRRSVEQNKQDSLLILELVQKMIQRKISIRSIEGPIGIGRAAGQAASKKGWTPLLELTAGISLNLGIFNLLPIPIMDGGVILLLFVESLMRRDISLRIKERIYQAAFVFLVLFAVMVIYNDVAEDAA